MMDFEDYHVDNKGILADRLTGDRVVNSGPVFLFGVQIVSDGGGVADIGVYDGQNTSGEQVLDLTAASGETYAENFIPPIYFSQGLYIDVGDNVTSVTVRYLSV